MNLYYIHDDPTGYCLPGEYPWDILIWAETARDALLIAAALYDGDGLALSLMLRCSQSRHYPLGKQLSRRPGRAGKIVRRRCVCAASRAKGKYVAFSVDWRPWDCESICCALPVIAVLHVAIWRIVRCRRGSEITVYSGLPCLKHGRRRYHLPFCRTTPACRRCSSSVTALLCLW